MILYYSIVYVLLQVFGEQKRHTFLMMKLLKVNATVAFAVALSLRRIMWYNLV